MDNEKIDEIGEKLNVNSSEIKPRKSPNWFKNHLFWIANATTFILSILFRIISGVIDKNIYFSNYPYISPDYFSPLSLLSASSINIANGVYTIPKRKYFKLNQIMRIGVYIINLIISFAVSTILFQSLGSYNNAIAYNVYKSPAQIDSKQKSN
ncbi:hypothetical protein ES708_22878 [subsurface metagenome]